VIDALRHSAAHVFVDSPASPVLSNDDQHHLERVLRLRNGESVTCSNGNGEWSLCEWRDSSLIVTSDVQVETRHEPVLTVAIAPVKGDRTDLVIEKLVEIGIDAIVVLQPVERSVVRWNASKVPQVMQRYERIVRAAAMQSRRVFLPGLTGPVALRDVVGTQVAFAEPGGAADPSSFTTLVIGPEGGFSPEEIASAPALADLGPAILRAETAAMVGAARMVAHWRR